MQESNVAISNGVNDNNDDYFYGNVNDNDGDGGDDNDHEGYSNDDDMGFKKSSPGGAEELRKNSLSWTEVQWIQNNRIRLIR